MVHCATFKYFGNPIIGVALRSQLPLFTVTLPKLPLFCEFDGVLFSFAMQFLLTNSTFDCIAYSCQYLYILGILSSILISSLSITNNII